MVAIIPFDKIDKVQIYINVNKKPVATIKKETGADYIINGTLYDMSTYKPVCYLKAEGVSYCKPDYTTWGYAWDNPNNMAMEVLSSPKANNIACVCMIRDNQKQVMKYDSALGGKRGRSAIGLNSSNLILCCTADGSNETMNPEDLQTKMYNLGCTSAIMLDGGGSSQCDFNGQTITSSRKVQNLILVYLKKEVGVMSTKKVMLDPGHGAGCVNGSPDKTYYEHEFTLDFSFRLKKILERCGIEVFMTRTDSTDISLNERCKKANTITDLDLLVSVHSNAVSAVDSEGWSTAKGLSCHIIAKGGNAEKASKAMVERFKEAGITVRNESVVVSNFQMVRETDAPAVLIEHGFHTNKKEVALLKTDAYRQKLAIAEAKGICDHLGVTYVEEEAPTSESSHWAQKHFDNLIARGIQLSDTRFDDNITRGEAFALADKILDAIGK